LAKVLNIFSIFPRPSKKSLTNSKFHNSNISKKSYAQASKSNIKDIVYIKDIFPKLSTKKIIEINDIVNKNSLAKSRKNMTIKELSRKQVIIPISTNNAETIDN